MEAKSEKMEEKGKMKIKKSLIIYSLSMIGLHCISLVFPN